MSHSFFIAKAQCKTYWNWIYNTLMKVHFLASLYYRRKKVIKKASSLKMEISAERLDEPKKKFWLVLSQLISRAAAAATACIA